MPDAVAIVADDSKSIDELPPFPISLVGYTHGEAVAFALARQRAGIVDDRWVSYSYEELCPTIERPIDGLLDLAEKAPKTAAWVLDYCAHLIIKADYPDTSCNLKTATNKLLESLYSWADEIKRFDRANDTRAAQKAARAKALLDDKSEAEVRAMPLRQDEPPQHAVYVSVGVGKTEQTLRMIAHHEAFGG